MTPSRERRDREREKKGSSVIFEKPPLKMWLMNYQTMIRRYGGQQHPRLDQYDVLRDSGELVEWRYVPLDATTIYVSHEWTGSSSPDHNGTQMYHLLRLLRRLREGEISRTDMDAFHSLLYKHNYSTTAEEWKQVLDPEKTFIWYDGFSVPESKREDGFRSIPAYIQRCDFMIILAPGCTHVDKIDPRTKRKMNLCYRTYRLDARCVFEMFSSFLSTKGGEKAKPALSVRSGTGIPKWISPLECQKLAVGTSSFGCCETNHTVIKKCRRPVSLELLDRLIEERARSLFEKRRHEVARMMICLKKWWLRGLDFKHQKVSNVKTFKNILRWKSPDDNEWFDRCDFPVLLYASLNDQRNVVKELLENISEENKNLRTKYLCSRIPKSGLSTLGFTGHTSALHCAMAGASYEVVVLLLQHGADPYDSDIAGNDPLMFASIFGRTDNVKFWLKRFPDWDLERKNKVAGGVALSHAVFMGPRRFELVKVLLEHGASCSHYTDLGSSILITLCSSEDADPELLKLLLSKMKSETVNYMLRGRSLKWRNIIW